MSIDWQNDVKEFNESIGNDIEKTPKIPNDVILSSAYCLICEEYTELCNALGDRNLPDIIDAVVDSIYVLLGMSVRFGVDLQPIWDAVQDANMAKLNGPKRMDGKQLKPKGWVAPDVEKLLKDQGWVKKTECEDN